MKILESPLKILESPTNVCLDMLNLLYETQPTQCKTIKPELGTFEWWISGLMHDPLFFLISRLNNACSPLVINLQIN